MENNFQNEHIKTESNGLGILKTVIIFLLMFLQIVGFILLRLYVFSVFNGFLLFSIIMTLFTCIHALSSDYNGQAKAMWILFLLTCFSFGYIFYIFSSKKIMFRISHKKYNKILKKSENLQKQIDTSKIENAEVRIQCNYLYNAGRFETSLNSKTTYYSSGVEFFDAILFELQKAKKFILIEFYIVSNGILFNKIFNILKEKAEQGVEIKIIYDDIGCHRTLSRKTRKKIKKAGIELYSFNRLIPFINIALNFRDHRKLVVVDGKVAFTGGANIADEYINEKQLHGFWKDCGIKIEGQAVDNFTISILNQWEFINKKPIEYKNYLYKSKDFESSGVVIPFVTGPNYNHSIAQNIYANEISNAKEKLYIMTPYFIPDETILNLLKNKAISGVDVRIIIPDIADKKFVYTVTRNNAEKLIPYGIKVYTMNNSFVHSKVVLTENSAIVGSINMDLRSFNQQFESAVFTSEQSTLGSIARDFDSTFNLSNQITKKDFKRNKTGFRILAGLFNLISPFM